MTDSGNEQNALPERLRTVTPNIGMQQNKEMNIIGWMVFAGLLVLVLPLVPVFAVGWLLMKVFGRRTGE